MDLPGGGGGEDFSFDSNGGVAAAGREQQELWRNANAFSRYESTLGELREELWVLLVKGWLDRLWPRNPNCVQLLSSLCPISVQFLSNYNTCPHIVLRTEGQTFDRLWLWSNKIFGLSARVPCAASSTQNFGIRFYSILPTGRKE